MRNVQLNQIKATRHVVWSVMAPAVRSMPVGNRTIEHVVSSHPEPESNLQIQGEPLGHAASIKCDHGRNRCDN